MSIRVTDFKWEKGKNDVKYIELLEKTLKNEQVITARAVAKIRILVTENEKLEKEKQEIRVKTIDELKNKICMHFADWQYSEDDKWIKNIIELASESVEEISEQMKAGEYERNN